MGAMKMGDERRATDSIYGPALANKIECEREAQGDPGIHRGSTQVRSPAAITIIEAIRF